MESTSPIINSVWSSYGHDFLTDDSTVDDDGNVTGYSVSCIRCGGTFNLNPTPNGRNDGEYVNYAGAIPVECGGPDMGQHGYEGIEGIGAIEAHNCNCNHCTA